MITSYFNSYIIINKYFDLKKTVNKFLRLGLYGYIKIYHIINDLFKNKKCIPKYL